MAVAGSHASAALLKIAGGSAPGPTIEYPIGGQFLNFFWGPGYPPASYYSTGVSQINVGTRLLSQDFSGLVSGPYEPFKFFSRFDAQLQAVPSGSEKWSAPIAVRATVTYNASHGGDWALDQALFATASFAGDTLLTESADAAVTPWSPFSRTATKTFVSEIGKPIPASYYSEISGQARPLSGTPTEGPDTSITYKFEFVSTCPPASSIEQLQSIPADLGGLTGDTKAALAKFQQYLGAEPSLSGVNVAPTSGYRSPERQAHFRELYNIFRFLLMKPGITALDLTSKGQIPQLVFGVGADPQCKALGEVVNSQLSTLAIRGGVNSNLPLVEDPSKSNHTTKTAFDMPINSIVSALRAQGWSDASIDQFISNGAKQSGLKWLGLKGDDIPHFEYKGALSNSAMAEGLDAWDISGPGTASSVLNPFTADDFAAQLTTGSPVSMSQVIDIPDVTSQLQFETYGDLLNGKLDVALGSQILLTLTGLQSQANGFSFHSVDIPSSLLGMKLAQLSFTYDGPSGIKLLVDNVSIASVPESSSAVLILTGLACGVISQSGRRAAGNRRRLLTGKDVADTAS